MRYIKKWDGTVIITRVILMELASHSGMLCQEYVEYIKRIKEFEIDILIVYEEDLFSFMEMCFNSNSVINSYLCWAVRTIKDPVSSITEMLLCNRSISREVIEGKNLNHSEVYNHFFRELRKYKETGDNLGEEILAICLHILSYIPGEKDGKFCIITDDKNAAAKIDGLFKKTATRHKGRKIILYSTPKLVQAMYRENILQNKEHVEALLATGTDGNIVVLGTLVYDIQGREISKNKEELAHLIMQPNGIQIIF
ncbi:MAG: hypothetical protein LUF92_08395 [Clostridiales bacterium]|nr:hypothetical protein [Clostridiales bacterium]